MSKISVVYDRLRVLTPTLTGFTDKTEIPNPYSLVDNDFNLLREGYGIKVESGNPASSTWTKSFSEQRIFTVVVTQGIFSVTHDPEQIVTAAKDLLEDSLVLKQAFLDNTQLSIPSDIEIVHLVSSGPVDFVQGDKYNFLVNETSFAIQIRENL